MDESKTLNFATNRKGHSLTELLVALLLVSVLLLLLFSMLQHTTAAWRGGTALSDVNREARAALGCIRSDLQNLRTGTHLPLYINNPVVSASARGHFAPPDRGDKIFFLSVLPRQAQDPLGNKSDLCSIGYYLAESSPQTNPAVWSLHRYFHSSDSTWAWGTAMPGNGWRAFLLNPAAVLFQPPDSGNDEVLARNVVNFFISPFRSDLTAPSPWPDRERPALFHIQLRLCDQDSARRTDPVFIMRQSRFFQMRVAPD